MPIMQPYQIQQPIRNLQQLKAEKRKLRAHIKTSDEALRQRIESMPAVAMLRGLQQFGGKIIRSKAGSYAADFFTNNNNGKVWPGLLKSVALFAGMQVAKFFFGKKEGKQRSDDWMSMFADAEDDD